MQSRTNSLSVLQFCILFTKMRILPKVRRRRPNEGHSSQKAFRRKIAGCEGNKYHNFLWQSRINKKESPRFVEWRTNFHYSKAPSRRVLFVANRQRRFETAEEKREKKQKGTTTAEGWNRRWGVAANKGGGDRVEETKTTRTRQKWRELFHGDAIFQARPRAWKTEREFTSLVCRWLSRFIPNHGEGLLFAV